MTTHRLSRVSAAVLVSALAQAGCGSSKSDSNSTKSTSGPATTATGGNASSATTTKATKVKTGAAKSTSQASMPSSACLLTDAQASAITGQTLKGVSTDMDQTGKFCAYTEPSSEAGISISVKWYDDIAQGTQLAQVLNSNAASQIYSSHKALSVGDTGGVAVMGSGANSGAVARFMKGHINVEITVRPGSMDKGEQAAKEAAAKL